MDGEIWDKLFELFTRISDIFAGEVLGKQHYLRIFNLNKHHLTSLERIRYLKVLT
jgi:hypothetical protein